MKKNIFQKILFLQLLLVLLLFRRQISDDIKFVVCFIILTNYRLERRLYVKLRDWISNSEAPDATVHLDLCCLQKPIIIVCGSERDKG